MRTLIILLTATIASSLSLAQQGWVTRISGPATCDANAIAVGTDGAVYAGGSWQGTGTNGTDMFLAKLDKTTGDTLWTRFYRSVNYDKVNDLALTDSGDVVAVGQSNNQYTVLHYWSDGTFRRAWRDVLHLSTGSYAAAVCTDETGAAYVTGNAYDGGSSYNIYTMKFSSTGDSLWARVYAPPTALADIAYNIAVDGGHNCYVAGVSGSDILTIKLNAAGDTAWTRQYHGPTAGSDAGYAVALDGEGNVYVAGETHAGGILAACIISYTPAGALRFVKTYTSPARIWDSFSDVAIDSSGNVIATGTGKVSQYLQATLLAKYSSIGDSLWARTYRPSTADASLGWRVAVGAGGLIYVAGHSRTGDFDLTALGYGPSGALIRAREYSGSGSYDDASRDIAVGDSGRVYTAGAVLVSPANSDFTVICHTDLATSVEAGEYFVPFGTHLMQNYPNPFNPGTAIRYHLSVAGDVRLVVYDVLGREIEVLADGKKMPGDYVVNFDAAGLASGVYLFRLTAGDFAQTRKLVLIR